MPTIKLTQPAVDRLKPPASGRVEYWDNQLPGFGLRISAPRPGTREGRKTWVALYRVNGHAVRETFGTTALLPSVAEAREKARQSMQAAQTGVNPVQQRRGAARAAELAEKKAAAETFGAVADRYMAEYVEQNTKPATIKETRRILERDVKPKWGDRPIWEITRQDVLDLLNEIADNRKRPRRGTTGGAAVQSNRTLARLKTLLRWALDEELIATDPTARVRRRVKETARDRALSDDEIRWFWSACDEIGWPFGPLFKALLLTAQRRDEVGRWNGLRSTSKSGYG